MLKILLIRHGESTGNRDRRMTGHLQERLTPKGQRQCQCLATHLHRQGWQPDHVYVSPLRRAVESLEFLIVPWAWQLSTGSNSLGGEIGPAIIKNDSGPSKLCSVTPLKSAPTLEISEQLAEFQAGVLTGLTWTEAKRQYPELCHQLETTLDWVPIPGAETPLKGRERAYSFVQQLLTRHPFGDAIWVISHHWIMEHIVACLMGCDRTWQITIPNTAVFEFWIDVDRWFQGGMAPGISDLWQIKQFAACHHLSNLD